MEREAPRQTYSIIDTGTGELISFPDTYNGQEENFEAAEKMQQFILDLQTTIDSSFLQLGAALKVMRDQELYLALGLPTLKAWMESPQLHISYRLAIDLIRIVEELVPKLGDEVELSVSAMRELLPLLGTEHETALAEIADEIGDMTVRDARDHIRDLRGIEAPTPSVLFRARVEMGEVYHRVWITRVGGADGDIYELNQQPLRIKPNDWSRWLDRFSEGLVEYE